MGPLLRREAVGKQHLLVAGQTRQMHSSTKDPKRPFLTTVHTSGPLHAHQNSQDVGWETVEVRDSGMSRA